MTAAEFCGEILVFMPDEAPNGPVAPVNAVWLVFVARPTLAEEELFRGLSRFLESLTLRDMTLEGILCIGGASGFYKGMLLT